MASTLTCPVCAAKVSTANLPGHLRRVHPGEDEALAEAEDTARKAPRKKAVRRARRAFAIPKWFVVVVALVLVGVAAAYLISIAPPGPAAFQHVHPTLRITANGASIPIPGGIGQTAQGFGSIHTHGSDGVLHLEGRPPQTLGDFFRVWGQALSPNQVMGFVVDGTRSLTMTVDGEPSTLFGDLVLEDGMAIQITYGPK